MEKEGLERVLNFLDEQDLTVETLVTDRHKQINKWLRETHDSIAHYFDIWHVAKGSSKCFFIFMSVYIVLFMSQVSARSWKLQGRRKTAL